MSIPHVSSPSLIFTVRLHARRFVDVEMQHIQTILTVLYLGHHAPAPIPDSEEADVEHYLVPIFFQLTETHYICSEPLDQADDRQHLVFIGLTLDEDDAPSLDVRHSPITKPHGVVYLVIDLHESATLTSHVVHGTRVEDPPRAVVVLPAPELDEQLPFIEVNCRLLWRGHHFSDGGAC
jgi:hypothetical protein